VAAEVVGLPYLQQQVLLPHYFEQPGNLMIPDTCHRTAAATAETAAAIVATVAIADAQLHSTAAECS
jgi:hypothetical protein